MVRKANVIAVMSPKGGVGKTVTTANLAAVLATKFDKKILAIDTNVSTASLGLHLDIFYPKNTIHDLLGKRFAIGRAIHIYNDNLHIIPASIKIRKQDRNIKDLRTNIYKIVKHYDRLLKNLSKYYDLIFLDSSPGFDIESIAAMHVAGGLLIVTNPDYPSIVTAAKTIEYAKAMKIPMGGLVLNKVRNKKYELKGGDIEAALGIKIIGEIPFDKKIPESIAKRKPLVLLKPRSKASKAYRKLAESMVVKKPKKSNPLEGIKKFFKRK